ncbi:MAG: hypothetical protein H0T51_11780, partial [Pirellulales bacterium]|nr:hypothetical protein [Pirellulales bacterium]
EMTGATVTVVFSDGTTTTSQTYRTAGNNRASQTIADTGLPPTPGLMLLGSVTPPAHVSTANQTVRITGPAGATARLFHIEASLHLAGVPNGGFDLDPFEANKATTLTDLAVTIGAGGFVDVPIVLTKSEQEGGYNYITAVIQDSQGRTSDNAPKIVLAYNVSQPPDPGSGAAKVEVYSQGAIGNSSTARVDSFRFHNNAADGREIASISVNLNTSFMPDVVYDPNGSAGDVVGIGFTPDAGGAATGQSTHQFSLPRDGGFDKLEVFFTDFDPGETFTFHLDIDPTSVKGSAAPGPAGASSISGLELSGATVTVQFEDGGSMTGQLFALDEGAEFYKVHAEIVLNEAALPAAPSLLAVGVGTAPAIVGSAAQTIRIAGPVGASVRLLQTETALHLAGVPGGGFDVDPFEANKVVFVRDDVAVIGAGGFVDVPVTLRDSLAEGGLNYFIAVVELPDGRTSSVSNVIKLALNNLPPGSNPGSPAALSAGSDALHSAGDYSGDGVVDGADFLTWQRALGSPAEPLGSGADGDGSGVVDGDDLAMWQDQFGATVAAAGSGGGTGSSAALVGAESFESAGINVDLSGLWYAQNGITETSLAGELRDVEDDDGDDGTIAKPPLGRVFDSKAQTRRELGAERQADRFYSTLSGATGDLRFASFRGDEPQTDGDGCDNADADGLDEFDLAFAALL